MKSAITTLMFSTLVACSGNSGDTRGDCTEGKCDKPEGTVEEQCTNSRTSSMDERRPHFTPDGVRWSCRDVNGVTADGNTTDDRGQEYCEYFSMLHTAGIPAVITNEQGPVFCDDMTPCSQGTCDTSIFSCVTGTTVDTTTKADVLGKNVNDQNKVTALDPKLSAGQIEWLAQNPTQKVGECVFTSWHKDIPRPIESTETVGGHSLDAKAPGVTSPLFRMAVRFNSNGAAKALVQDCLSEGKQAIEDGFMRGCTVCGDLDGGCVPWRKSDPSVCTMAMRIVECGCSIDIKDEAGNSRKLDLESEADLELAKDLFVPESRRGFTLGSWDGIGQLPTGCRYVRTGDPQSIKVGETTITDPNADQTLIACDLKASHISAATAKDPKEACRQVYGEEVVVHVRAPNPEAATLSCDTTRPNCQGVPWDFANL
jgi:hypothetical protein